MATSILLQFYVMSDLEPRLNTIENLHTSEAARERIQKQHEALQVQSDRHDNYASTLTRSNTVFENENMKLQQQNAELTAENEYYKNQIDQLLDMLAASKSDEQPTEEQISYPVDITPCNAFLFGGQPDFQAKLRQLIPNLRVDQRIDKASLSNADIVFLQVEYFNHGLYYGIMNICRLNNIPVVYLNSTGAKKAADQIVKEITQIQGAK